MSSGGSGQHLWTVSDCHLGGVGPGPGHYTASVCCKFSTQPHTTQLPPAVVQCPNCYKSFANASLTPNTPTPTPPSNTQHPPLQRRVGVCMLLSSPCGLQCPPSCAACPQPSRSTRAGSCHSGQHPSSLEAGWGETGEGGDVACGGVLGGGEGGEVGARHIALLLLTSVAD